MNADEIAALLDAVRNGSPLVHNITNYVAMNNSANAVLAIGGSPAMIHSLDEVGDFVAIADGLVINIGTLDSLWLAAMRLAIVGAARKPIPWVLDPVGAGVSRYRLQASFDFLAARPTVLRGNASEIAALSRQLDVDARGVDSTVQSDDVRTLARDLASKYRTIVAVTGANDYVTDGTRIARIESGHRMMTRVTALGCSLSAVVSAFVAVAPERPLEATIAALAVFGASGAQAAGSVTGPGDLQVSLLNNLYRCDRDMIAQFATVTWE